MHLAFARSGLAVADDPDIGADAGVVEHVGGQAHDGFAQVVLQHVAADFALATAGAAGEQGRAVEHDAKAAAALGCRAHLAQQVQQKQHGAIGHTGQPRTEAAVVALLLVLFAHFFFDLLPLHAKRWVGQHVVELLVTMAVVAERVAKGDVAHVLALDQHVGLADGVRLGVELLAKDGEARLGVVLGQVFTRHAEHAARARCGVVNGAHHAGFAEDGVVFNEDEVDHEPDDLTRGEVLPGGLVADFGELADQLLKHQAHLHVADRSIWANFSATWYSSPALARRSTWVWNSKRSNTSRTAGENACT